MCDQNGDLLLYPVDCMEDEAVSAPFRMDPVTIVSRKQWYGGRITFTIISEAGYDIIRQAVQNTDPGRIVEDDSGRSLGHENISSSVSTPK